MTALNCISIIKLTEVKHETSVDGLVQDCSNSSALAKELLQSYTKPSILPKQP